ncbi:hypothetical protein TetV_636 [Tetraselmis virus 1]|uniref:Uncharacterized protein n=1 Tax=Tetraselmis virus 1 TaxID=2060617 RepID=A0A2P0VP85_9VIRU|nr:hypothetical protein QJ968_gp418 [Tetraselmis virus 1]AUF82718.1 hypothetical protein TetV_636 [Tetraselmis virus 1]
MDIIESSSNATLACEKCDKHANYGYEWKKPRWCVQHKPEDAKDVVSKQCEHLGCCVQPIYGYEWKKPRWCSKHAPGDSMDVVHKKCEHPECSVVSSYGYEWKKPRWCVQHKPEDAKDVVHKKCEHPECSVKPSYGYEWKKPRWCVQHKPEDAKDVVSKKCEHLGCCVQPIYGYEWKKPRWCSKHAPEDAKDVVSKKCEHPECSVKPSYGYEWMKPRWCSKHAPEDAKDVVSKKCEHPECSVRPSYGYEWKKPRWCSKHAPEDAKDVVSKKCEHPECSVVSSYGYEWMKPRWCVQHAPDDAKDVVHKMCSSCNLTYPIKNENKCASCLSMEDPKRLDKYLFRQRMFVGTTPDEISRNDYLSQRGYNRGMINRLSEIENRLYDTNRFVNDDKSIQGTRNCLKVINRGSSGSLRVDSWIQLSGGTMIFEPAEDQHGGETAEDGHKYSPSCELSRAFQLAESVMDHDHTTPTHLVFCNTDDFIHNGVEYKSAFAGKTNKMRGIRKTVFLGRMEQITQYCHNILQELSKPVDDSVPVVHIHLINYSDNHIELYREQKAAFEDSNGSFVLHTFHTDV